MLSEETKERLIRSVNRSVAVVGGPEIAVRIGLTPSYVIDGILGHRSNAYTDEAAQACVNDLAANREEAERIIAGILGVM